MLGAHRRLLGLRITTVMSKYQVKKGRGKVAEEFDPMRVPDEDNRASDATISVHEPGRPINAAEFAQLKDLAKRRKVQRKGR